MQIEIVSNLHEELDLNFIKNKKNMINLSSPSSAHNMVLLIQSTLVISNSKELSEILRDIRTSTYQICTIEEKNRLTTFDKYMCS